MSVLETGQPGAGSVPVFHTIAALVAGLMSWRTTRLTRRALRRLSDHELDDIGLCRSDVEHLTF